MAYVIGVLIQIPFMHSTLYVGPVSEWMGGAEISWILGLAVAGGLYYAFSARIRNEAAARHVLATHR